MDAGIAFSVVAALVWGVYLFSLKRYFDGYPASVITVGVNAAAILWYAPVAALTLDAADLAVFGSLSPSTVGVAVGTDLALAAALVLFFRALAVGDVSYVAPINKLVPVFVLPVELLFLGAHLTPLQVGGVLVATTAVYVANYRRGPLLDPIRRAASYRPAQLALVSAALFGLSDVGKRLALSNLALPTQVWVLWIFGGVLVVLLPAAIRGWSKSPDERRRRSLAKFLVAGALVAFGEHVTSLAFAVVPASVASPIINTQAIVAVVLGGLLLGERGFRTRLVASVLAVTGVTLIAV
jgi:drug/metabolite transporter (DMT)-like permease